MNLGEIGWGVMDYEGSFEQGNESSGSINY
jgi:hypothetical protein